MQFVAPLLFLALTLALPGSVYAEDEAADEEVVEPEPSEVEDTESAESAAEPVVLAAPSAALFEAENSARVRVNRIGMLTLGGWALGNFGWATVGLLRTPEDRERAFHLSNAAWNIVNAGLAVTGYFSNLDQDWTGYDALKTLEEDHRSEKLYLFSAALDLAFIATGAYFTARGNLDEKEGMVGMGRSFMLQGAFLLVFDSTLFAVHSMRRTDFLSKLGE